jgi:rare lipoprotein A (peptidoglycan hydrolase)
MTNGVPLYCGDVLARRRPVSRWASLAILAGLLGGCASQGSKPVASSGMSLAEVQSPAGAVAMPPANVSIPLTTPAKPPVLSRLGDLALEREKAVLKVGKPYKVAGLWYVPKHQPDYDETGTASWYGPNFHGKSTANGEVYNQTRLSGAHPTLPLLSYVEVTNLANGRTVVVRVNDRGPYKRGRILDLSARAAQLLGYQSNGTAQVRVRYVGRAPLAGDDRYERDFLARQAWYGGAATANATQVAEVDFTASIDMGDPAPAVATDAIPAEVETEPTLKAPMVATVLVAPATTEKQRVASSK